MKRCFRCVLRVTFVGAGHTLGTLSLPSQFGKSIANPCRVSDISSICRLSDANLPFSMFRTNYFTSLQGYRPLAYLRNEDSHDPSQSHFLRCSSRLFNSDVRDFSPCNQHEPETAADCNDGFDSSKLPAERARLRSELRPNRHGRMAGRWSAL